MYHFRYVLILSFLLFDVSALYARQATFTGKIIDSRTQQPVPGANIFLSGTTYGASSDKDGNFLFDAPVQGRFNFVVSFIGYKRLSKPILIKETVTVFENIALEPDIIALNSIEVISTDNKRWRKAFEAFKEFFLGTDEYAYFCEILNPTALNFNWDDSENLYYVFSNEPLIIKNNALGYVITAELDQVYFNPKTNGGVYTMFPHFDEMIPENPSMEMTWKSNRKKIYESSSRYFFKSLSKESISSSKFTILQEDTLLTKSQDSTLLKLYYPTNWKYLYHNYSVFRITERSLKIGYDIDFGRSGRIKNRNNISTIHFTGLSDLLVIDDFGFLYNPDQVQFIGKWERDRFAKHLPKDFQLNQ